MLLVDINLKWSYSLILSLGSALYITLFLRDYRTLPIPSDSVSVKPAIKASCASKRNSKKSWFGNFSIFVDFALIVVGSVFIFL